MPRHPAQPTLLSLFAGAGGLDLGLERAGFVTLAANELEPHACATLRANQLLPTLDLDGFEQWFSHQLNQRCYRDVTPVARERLHSRLTRRRTDSRSLQHAEIVERDIKATTSAELMRAAGVARGELTLVAGGPPCQPFSRAGKRESVETDEGRLFLEFVRVVSDTRPRWFLFENVKGLLLTKTELVEFTCGVCGNRWLPPFRVRVQYLETGNLERECECGAAATSAQRTTKPGGSLDIIISEFEAIGYKCHWRVLNAADFGVPQLRERLFVVGSRDGESFAWPRATHASPAEADREQLALFDSAANNAWISIHEALWRGAGHGTYGELDLAVARLWVKNVVRPHAEPVTWTLDRPSPTVGAHQAAKLAIAPLGVPEEQLARQQWHVKGKRQGDLPPVPVKHEYLSDSELLRLQTFPENWYLFGTRMQRAFQIGNAVPVNLARAVGAEVLAASNLGNALRETA